MPRGRTQRIVPRPPQNTNELFEKLKNHQANIMEKRNNKNVISINPEMKNLIIKSKKVLSVSYFPLGWLSYALLLKWNKNQEVDQEVKNQKRKTIKPIMKIISIFGLKSRGDIHYSYE